MDWFLYERDFRHERVNVFQYSAQDILDQMLQNMQNIEVNGGICTKWVENIKNDLDKHYFNLKTSMGLLVV